jgi:hypothetical protein
LHLGKEQAQLQCQLTLFVRDFNGVRQVLWNERFFHIKPGVGLTATYSSTLSRGPIRHMDHGYLSHLSILHNGITSTLDDQAAAFYQVFFSIPGSLTNHRTEHLGIFTSDHAVTAGDPGNPVSCSTADVIYTFNRRTSNRSGGIGYPASQVLLPKSRTGIPPTDKQSVNNFLDPLIEVGLITLVGYGTPESHREICTRINHAAKSRKSK